MNNAFILLLLSLLLLLSTAAAAGRNGTRVADTLLDGEEFLMESETGRRILAAKPGISYGGLNKDGNVCNGNAYGNCNGKGKILKRPCDYKNTCGGRGGWSWLSCSTASIHFITSYFYYYGNSTTVCPFYNELLIPLLEWLSWSLFHLMHFLSYMSSLTCN